METFQSSISHKTYPISDRITAFNLRKSILLFVQKKYPDFDQNSTLSVSELNELREMYISEYMISQLGELTHLEKKVVKSINSRTLLADELQEEDEDPTRDFGQKVADKVASFGGSWTFIISFLVFIFFSISINVFWINHRSFDPFPFILLNLILSCIAALQAPVIMMSQNRQEDKDRQRAKKDYMINLKSEVEIRTLHEKIDHLIIHQQQDLLELQKIQIEMMHDILDKMK